MTGLAQWAGTRTGAGGRGGRGPGSIPGEACLGDMSDEFRTFLGIFHNLFGHVWGCSGDLLGPFGVGLGEFLYFV